MLDLSTTSVMIHRIVCHTYGDASVNLYLSQPAACTTTRKTGEQNSVSSIESEAELALDALYYRSYDRYEALRGIFATAELLVKNVMVRKQQQ